MLLCPHSVNNCLFGFHLLSCPTMCIVTNTCSCVHMCTGVHGCTGMHRLYSVSSLWVTPHTARISIVHAQHQAYSFHSVLLPEASLSALWTHRTHFRLSTLGLAAVSWGFITSPLCWVTYFPDATGLQFSFFSLFPSFKR